MGSGLGAYQDQIQELSGQVTQPIKDALGEVKDNILVLLGNLKDKVMSLPSAFSSTSLSSTVDVEDNGHDVDGISIRHL